MAYLVELTEPHSVGIRGYDDPTAGSGEVVVRTWYSGISAGTELGMYRGTNPYLDEALGRGDRAVLPWRGHLLLPDGRLGLLRGRQVEKVGPACQRSRSMTWSGASGATARTPCCRPNGSPDTGSTPSLDPIVGTFDRVGAVALNAVLASDARIGETVVVFGQGVIGLLATQLLVSQGCQVLAVDTMPARLEGRPGVRRHPAVGLEGDLALTVRERTRRARRGPGDRADRGVYRPAPGDPGAGVDGT